MYRQLIASILDLLFVPHCAACDVRVHTGQALCPQCAVSLYELGPACPRCAEPQARVTPRICARCRRAPPPFASAHAGYRYGGELAVALRQLKDQRRPDIARALAPLVQPALAASIARTKTTLAIPVPLDWRRRWQRGFNQANLLLTHASRGLGYDSDPDHKPGSSPRPNSERGPGSDCKRKPGPDGEREPSLTIAIDRLSLRRIRPTAPQRGQRRRQRTANLQSAFAVAPRRRAHVAGKRILVFDDVMTTGATMAACARALLAAGAAEVHTFAVARTERDPHLAEHG